MKVLRRVFFGLLLVTLAAALSIAFLRGWGLLLRPHEADPAAWEMWGVDVSSYQGVVDWTKLAEQGVDFAFIKATEGSSLRDSCYETNWSEAEQAGVLRGAYHFFSYDSAGEDQADNFIRTVPRTEGALPPVVDIEFYGSYLDEPLAAEEVRPILDALLERLEAHYGQRPILYATERSYRLYIRGRYEAYPLWVSMPVLAPIWRPWTFWQYSHSGYLSGYSGVEEKIDFNVFRGTAEELRQFCR